MSDDVGRTWPRWVLLIAGTAGAVVFIYQNFIIPYKNNKIEQYVADLQECREEKEALSAKTGKSKELAALSQQSKALQDKLQACQEEKAKQASEISKAKTIYDRIVLEKGKTWTGLNGMVTVTITDVYQYTIYFKTNLQPGKDVEIDPGGQFKFSIGQEYYAITFREMDTIDDTVVISLHRIPKTDIRTY